jgi:hypothetical protein
VSINAKGDLDGSPIRLARSASCAVVVQSPVIRGIAVSTPLLFLTAFRA